MRGVSLSRRFFLRSLSVAERVFARTRKVHLGMRDTQYTLYTHQRYGLNGSVDGTSGILDLSALFRLREFPRVFLFMFFWNGVFSRAEKVQERTRFAYKVPLHHRRPIVSRQIRDVIYRGREIRCNESRCYGRIKASGKLIR